MMKNLFGIRSLRLLLALALLPMFSASAQVVVTNGVLRYNTLSATTVTMTDRCELWVTNAAPLSGCTINLNSSNAWLFLPGVVPSATVSTYLGQVSVNGAAAVADSNCRVVQYGAGSVVIPHSSGFQPLQVFTGTNFTGTSGMLSQYTAYTDSNLGTFVNSISSFRLKRGYMVTFAQNSDGTGISRNFIAADGDLDVSYMPPGLDDTVSFVRIFPWRWAIKKGTAGNPGISQLNAQWWYNWNLDQNSSRDVEYVPIRQNRYWPGLGQDWQARGANTVLGYNEPDNTAQANILVGDAIWSWPDLLGTGLRVGSPAVTDGGRSSWLYPFMTQAEDAKLRVDFIAIHYYQQNNPASPSAVASQMYNFLLNVYNNTGRPIWVTEWNNGANWTTGWPDPTYAQQQACISAMVDMLENTPFVERYSIYNWVEDVRAMTTNGVLTGAGTVYRDKASRIGYLQDGIPGSVRGIARYRFEGDALDSSSAGNNGIAVGAPNYAAGTNGQAIQLDGTNSYIILPDNTANFPAFTFASWVNWDGGANWQRIFDFGNDSTTQGGTPSQYMFVSPNAGNSAMRFVINAGGGEQILTNRYALPIGQWTHVAVTISNTTARLYTNGVIAASSTSFSVLPSSFNPKRNYLGKSQFSSDPFFKGKLDDMVLAHYAMSPAEIASLAGGAVPVFLDIGNGVWASDANGNWSDGNRWSTGQPANGVGYTADFTFTDITANRTVTVDSSRSIGALTFGDFSGSQNWIIAPGGTNSLTLDSGSATQPSMIVNTISATISAPLAGTNGFVKSGDGTLVLNGTNKLSGVLNVDTGSTTANDGEVCISSSGATTNISAINLRNNNSGFSTLQFSNGAIVTAPIFLSGRNTNVVSIQNLSGSNSLAGNLTINSGGAFYVLKSDAGTLSLGGTISSAATTTRNFTFQGAGDHYVSGAIQNGSATTINLNKLDSGNLILAGNNTFSGNVSVGGGAVKINSPLTIQTIPVHLACAATNALKFGAFTGATIGSLSGIGDVWLTNATLAALTLTNGGNNASSTYAGALRGSGGIVKTGSGALTLAGANVHSGATAIAGGSLKFASVTNVIATLQPVLWLSFDSVSGGVITNQGSGGWGLNGVITGTNVLVAGGGRFGNGLLVSNGPVNTGYVFVNNPVVNFNNTSAWTWGLWVKSTTAGGAYMYQGDGGWASGNTSLYLNPGSAATGTKGGGVRWGQGWQTGTATLNDGNWHFISMTCNAGTKTFYVDGNVDSWAVNSWSGNGTGSQLWIGGTADTGDGHAPLNGMIDEVAVFSRALTQAEIRSIYTNAPVAGKLSPASAVNLASGATLDLSGLPQTVASFNDLNGTAGLVTNSAASTPVTLVISNNLAGAANFPGLIADTSGANAISLIKSGSGTQVLSGANTYRGTTTVSNGALIVNSVLPNNSVFVRGGTLAGNGAFLGPVTVSSGANLAAGSNAIGTLTFSNTLTLQGGSFTRLELNRAAATNDVLVTKAAFNLAGTLVVSNLAGTLAAGDTFALFNPASAPVGNFDATNLPSLNPGLAWNWNPTVGVLSVYQTVATYPTNLNFTITANTLKLTWPAEHTGWRLQVQTNDFTTGFGTNWLDVAGATLTNSVEIPFDANLGNAFYRLVYP